MERCKRAIHLRTGERGTDQAIASWLRRHGVEVIDCADAYEACTFALLHGEQRPDLALIGVDWLAPAEFAIVTYFRETWPGLRIVVHGEACLTAALHAAAPTVTCVSAGELRRFLEDSPDALMTWSFAADRSRSLVDDWRPCPTDPTPHGQHSGDASESPVGGLNPGVTPRDASNEGVSMPRDILTKDELAALLEDDEM